jgi:hypothetical protein
VIYCDGISAVEELMVRGLQWCDKINRNNGIGVDTPEATRVGGDVYPRTLNLSKNKALYSCCCGMPGRSPSRQHHIPIVWVCVWVGNRHTASSYRWVLVRGSHSSVAIWIIDTSVVLSMLCDPCLQWVAVGRLVLFRCLHVELGPCSEPLLRNLHLMPGAW